MGHHRLEAPPLKIHAQKCRQEMGDISSVPRQAMPPKLTGTALKQATEAAKKGEKRWFGEQSIREPVAGRRIAERCESAM
jgi:hypothetical protein